MSEPVTMSYELPTGGKAPFVDRLAVIMQVFGEMEGNNRERRAALAYIADYYGFRIWPKPPSPPNGSAEGAK